MKAVKKLLFDRIDESALEGGGWNENVGVVVNRLAGNDVATVFLVSSEEVDPDRYLSLADTLSRAGFRLRQLHLSRINSARTAHIHKIMLELVKEYHRKSCAVISYGSGVTALLAACYYVFNGQSPTAALRRAGKIFPGITSSPDDVSMVFSYKKYLNDLNE